MNEIDTSTREQIHRGGFADGQATPDRYSRTCRSGASPRARQTPPHTPRMIVSEPSREALRGQPPTPPNSTRGRLLKTTVPSIDGHPSIRRAAARGGRDRHDGVSLSA